MFLSSAYLFTCAILAGFGFAKTIEFDPCWDFRGGNVDFRGAAVSSNYMYFIVNSYMYRFPLKSYRSNESDPSDPGNLTLNDPNVAQSERQKIDLTTLHGLQPHKVKSMHAVKVKGTENLCFRNDDNQVSCYSAGDLSSKPTKVNRGFLKQNEYLIVDGTGGGIKIEAKSDSTTIQYGALEKKDLKSLHFNSKNKKSYNVFKSTENFKYMYLETDDFTSNNESEIKNTITDLSNSSMKEKFMYDLGSSAFILHSKKLIFRRDFVFVLKEAKDHDSTDSERIILEQNYKEPEHFFNCLDELSKIAKKKQASYLIYVMVGTIGALLIGGSIRHFFFTESIPQVKISASRDGANMDSKAFPSFTKQSSSNSSTRSSGASLPQTKPSPQTGSTTPTTSSSGGQEKSPSEATSLSSSK